MKKFIVLYNAPSEEMRKIMKSTSLEEQKKNMDEWKAWMKQHSANFIDPGAPAGKNTHVTKDGAEEKPNEVGGYSVMQADSKEELIDVLRGGPHLLMPGSYMEVMELMEMPS